MRASNSPSNSGLLPLSAHQGFFFSSLSENCLENLKISWKSQISSKIPNFHRKSQISSKISKFGENLKIWDFRRGNVGFSAIGWGKVLLSVNCDALGPLGVAAEVLNVSFVSVLPVCGYTLPLHSRYIQRFGTERRTFPLVLLDSLGSHRAFGRKRVAVLEGRKSHP